MHQCSTWQIHYCAEAEAEMGQSRMYTEVGRTTHAYGSWRRIVGFRCPNTLPGARRFLATRTHWMCTVSTVTPLVGCVAAPAHPRRSCPTPLPSAASWSFVSASFVPSARDTKRCGSWLARVCTQSLPRARTRRQPAPPRASTPEHNPTAPHSQCVALSTTCRSRTDCVRLIADASLPLRGATSHVDSQWPTWRTVMSPM